MPRLPNTTNAQTKFLRAFRNPKGPPPDAWPSPAILRRWLRRPSFRAALASIRNSMRFRADIELAQAAAFAASSLSYINLDATSDETLSERSESRGGLSTKHIESAIALLRLSHIRQRFIDDAKDLPVVNTDNSLFHALRKINPDMTLGDALDYLAMRLPQFRLADAEFREAHDDDQD